MHVLHKTKLNYCYFVVGSLTVKWLLTFVEEENEDNDVLFFNLSLKLYNTKIASEKMIELKS